MRTTIQLLRGLMTLMFLLSFSLSSAITVTSTVSGGYWNDTLSWVGWRVPSTGDDVIINGTVSLNATPTVNNLTINSGKILQTGGYHHTLYVTGNLVNHGTIQDEAAGWDLVLNVAGNVTSDGLMTNYALNLTGTSNQYLTMNGIYPCQTYYMTVYDTLGTIYANSDISFQNCRVNFQYSKLDMQGNDLNVDNNYFYQGTILADGSKLYMQNGAYLQNVDVWNAELDGHIEVVQTVNLIGTTTLTGTLSNQSGYNYWVRVIGNFINNGSVSDYGNGWNLDFYINGDITNNGTWDNNYLYFEGTGDQTITQTAGKEFATFAFVNQDTNGMIIAPSGLNFRDSYVDLRTSKLSLPTGSDLNITGLPIYNGTIFANGNDIRMSNNSYMQDLNVYNAVLKGRVRLNGNNNHFRNTLTVADTLETHGYNHHTYVHGDLVNNGWIRDDGGWDLHLHAGGNITNNGLWTPSYTYLDGSTDQMITQMPGSHFECYHFYDTDAASAVIAAADLNFKNTGVRLNKAELLLPAGKLFVSGGYMFDFDIQANGNEIYMDNNAYMEVLNVHDAVLKGKVRLNGNGNHFWDNLIVADTLEPYGYNYNTYVHCDLINNGWIRDDGGWDLHIHSDADITNNGLWTPSYTYLDGSTDQTLTQAPGSQFECYQFFDTNDSSDVIAATDLNFKNTGIRLDKATLQLPVGSNVFVSGGYMYDFDVQANENEIYMDNNAYMQAMHVYDGVLKGRVRLYTDTNHFWNHLTVADTLEPHAYHYSTYVHGDLRNDGWIRDDSGWDLHINLEGNLMSNGQMTNYRLNFTGTTDQHISLLSGQVFNINYVYDLDTLGAIIADSDIDFVNSYVILNGSELVLAGNSDLSISGHYLRTGNLIANGNTLYMDNGAYLQTMIVENAMIDGTVKVYGNEVHFKDNLTVNGILEPRAYHYTTYIDGNIVNNNIVREDNGWDLYVRVTGNITNNGSWAPYGTYVEGDTNQYIRLVNDQSLHGNVYMYGKIGGTGPYWTKDGFYIPGSTSTTLTFTGGISKGHYGIYDCRTATEQSRLIFVEPSADCTGKDSYEPNDFIQVAANLYGGAMSGFGNMTLCPRGDEDWYHFTNNMANQTIRVNLKDLPRNYDLELYDPSGLLDVSINTGIQDDEIVYNFAATGIYAVRVFAQRGEWSPQPYNLSVSLMKPAPFGSVGTKPPVMAQVFRDADAAMKAYPNPVRDELNIAWTGLNAGKAMLSLQDMRGRVVLQEELQVQEGSNSTRLNVTGLTSGLYWLRFKTESRILSEKIVIE